MAYLSFIFNLPIFAILCWSNWWSIKVRW